MSTLTPIILASQSKNREKILSSLNIPFKIKTADINEKAFAEKNPNLRARKVAEAKAEKISRDHKGIIITCDTFTICEGKLLEKPKDQKEAIMMLKMLSGKSATCYTGFCYIDNIHNFKALKTAVTNVCFRNMDDKEIKSYVKRFPVTRWAAAYAASELYVLGLIDKISGSLTGLTHGLPLEHLIPLLKKSGYQPSP